MYQRYLKRALDTILACVALILLSPVFLILSAAIPLDSKGPVFFVQERLGQDGRIFKIYKFRTMVDGAFHIGAGADTYEGDPRITRVGGFLRKTSLDEIPQLINIIKGDMAIIGPRPLLDGIPYRYAEYPEAYRPRFAVLPGMFCSVDVKYRADVTFEKHMELDVDYVCHIRFSRDVAIFFGTFFTVLQMKSVYHEAPASEADESEALPAEAQTADTSKEEVKTK